MSSGRLTRALWIRDQASSQRYNKKCKFKMVLSVEKNLFWSEYCLLRHSDVQFPHLCLAASEPLSITRKRGGIA
jgi:hypothetical protein